MDPDFQAWKNSFFYQNNKTWLTIFIAILFVLLVDLLQFDSGLISLTSTKQDQRPK